MKHKGKKNSSFDSREFFWIEHIRKTIGYPIHGGIGIGDDSAVLPENLLWTTDAMVEGVHFLSSWPMEGVGYKSLATSASDIVAMGGKPLYTLLTVGSPKTFLESHYEKFLQGFQKAMRDFDIALMGGDTVRSDVIFFSITVLGKPFQKPILRSGANTGDFIYVSGTLGASAIGLELLLNKEIPTCEKEEFITSHLYPPCRISLMEKLLLSYPITAAIDCSDGFVADLDHIADESGVGYEIEIDKIPIPHKSETTSYEDFPLKYALGGGEDYEIIFTSPVQLPSLVAGVPITQVGKILPQERKLLWKGKPIKREKIHRGYIHF